MKKQKEAKRCEWCGTRFRQRQGCARGPACEAEQVNHLLLMTEIEVMDRGKAGR